MTISNSPSPRGVIMQRTVCAGSRSRDIRICLQISSGEKVVKYSSSMRAKKSCMNPLSISGHSNSIVLLSSAVGIMSDNIPTKITKVKKTQLDYFFALCFLYFYDFCVESTSSLGLFRLHHFIILSDCMSPTNIKELLLAPRLDPQQATALLSPYGFNEPAKADANLQAMADEPADRLLLAEILEELLSCVSQSADPDQALNHFERFARAAVNKTHLFSYLKDSPRTLEILARAFGGSQHMAEILLRDPVYLYCVSDPQTLYHKRAKREIARDILRALKGITVREKQLDYLRAIKRREMLHIGMRDLLRLCPVEDTLDALSI